jgi:cytochrome c peroxidase
MKRLALLASCLLAPAAHAACPGYSTCPATDFSRALKHNAGAQNVLADIDATEAATLQATGGNSLTFAQLFALLGELIVFDKTLSARQNEACALCHTQPAGSAGGIAAFNRTTAIYPGSVTYRAGFRKPMSLAYAAFSPVLNYNAANKLFYGGNFWDSRATGLITGSPSSDQALVPFVSPFEMALPDPACAVRRIAVGPYATLFANIWGTASLAITFPADTDRLCARPNNNGADQTPVPLEKEDRARATLTFEQIAETVGTYEGSAYASPFTAKFDLVQAGQASFTPAEAAGYALFNGQGKCVQCHATSGLHALFTDFSSANIGVPPNPKNPYLTENVPDRQGYVANPQGPKFVDEGLGGFLSSTADTNPTWQAQATNFMGAFQVPTLRNTTLSPHTGFPHAYTHNGFFHDLPTLVHFLNTRDVLPRCNENATENCWPAPEIDQNINHALTGNLGLSARQEAQLVSFIHTLADGATP